MAVPVVHGFEAVEVDIDQRGRCVIPLHIGERTGELALETAAVENFEQRIDVGMRFELGDAALRAGKLGAQTHDLGLQAGAILPFGHTQMTAPQANLISTAKNTAFALPAEGSFL